MTATLLIFWIILAILIVREERIARIIIYFGIFSLLTAIGYMSLGSPDVAMAEAAASAFTVIFFIICFEKYFAFTDSQMGSNVTKEKKLSLKFIMPMVFTLALFGLVLYFRPDVIDNAYLRDRILESFRQDVGGYNAVTAIYLGYRVYDTLFEALVVVLVVMACMHLSAYNESTEFVGRHSEMENSKMAAFAIQIVCPIMLLFGVYLVLNGHITPGGGFQGGLAIASFFICRYMIYDVNDLPIKKLNRMEEIVFVGITLFAVSIVFLGAAAYLPERIAPIFQTVYMLLMNAMIGLKVACGFIILFYRYIVVEQN